MRYFLIVLIALICCAPLTSRADLAVTLPWSLTFDDDTWTSNLALTECGGTSTHTTTGCYSGGCMKVTPPTSACTGGGINGGQTGLGWVTYSGTSEFHVRFLVKFGSTWCANVADGGGGLTNKFLLQDSPSRSGIMGFSATDSPSRYCAFAVYDTDQYYVYRTPPNRGWIEDALFKVSATEHVDEWIALEYWINESTGKTGLYIWTQDGEYNGVAIENVDAYATGISQTGFYLSYFNCYGTADSNNYYLMDNIVVSTSYIGPPTGFVGGSTPPTATGCTISGASMQ